MNELTQQELLLLEKQLENELILIKKCKGFAQAVQDSKLKTKIEQVAAQHENHYEKLLSHLK